VTALAASGTDMGCIGSDRGLRGLTVSIESLATQRVDHPSAGAKPAAIASEKSEAASKVAAPILQLAPHIAEMLSIVFNSNDQATKSEPSSIDESPTAGRSQKSNEADDNVLPMNAIVPSDDIARFQRQMYRKDI